MNKELELLEQRVNAYIIDSFPELCTRQPSYRYFRIGMNRYFWTTETMLHNGTRRYASGIYRYIKSKKQFKLTQERYHAKKKDAKERAYRLFKIKEG
jgi:hypothetical protein